MTEESNYITYIWNFVRGKRTSGKNKRDMNKARVLVINNIYSISWLGVTNVPY